MSQGPPSAAPTQPRDSAGWSASELAGDPHSHAGKQEKVRSMFAAIARSYDLNNRVHSLWRDQAWRRFAVKVSEVRPGESVLDCACGTGDLTIAFGRKLRQDAGRARGSAAAAGGAPMGAQRGRLVGLDYTSEMLDIARVKGPAGAGIEWMQGDAQALPFADASFDVVSIAFGIRNVQEPARAIGEFRRVLRPGGRLVVLEFAEPRLAPVRWFNDVYCRRVMPRTATWISGDKSGAYRYLPKSVSTFVAPESLKKMMEEAGFAAVRDWALSLGICRCYRAYVPTARRGG